MHLAVQDVPGSNTVWAGLSVGYFEMPAGTDLTPLRDVVLGTIPAPTYTEGAPLQAWVTNLDANPYLGRLALCRVIEGEIRKGQQVAWCRRRLDPTGQSRRALPDTAAHSRAGRPGWAR